MTAMCRSHDGENYARTMGVIIVTIGLAVILFAALTGCGRKNGISRERCVELLHQARTQNRECHRLLREYEREDCAKHPEQKMGEADFNQVGY